MGQEIEQSLRHLTTDTLHIEIWLKEERMVLTTGGKPGLWQDTSRSQPVRLKNSKIGTLRLSLESEDGTVRFNGNYKVLVSSPLRWGGRELSLVDLIPEKPSKKP